MVFGDSTIRTFESLPTMTVRFRPLLSRPDSAGLPSAEPLIVAPHPVEAAARLWGFREKTGLSTEDTLVSPVLNHPLPFYPATFPTGHRRWVGVHPSAMWHPLLWLPKRLTERVRIADDDSEVVESDEMWSVRVALELLRAGIYREDEGTWLDVLAHWGLDIDDPATQDRCRAWLAGGDDELLDSIDLDEILRERLKPNWAIDFAWRVTPDVITQAWAIQSNALLDLAEQTRDELNSGQIDPEAAQSSVDEIVAMGTWLFDTVPMDVPAEPTGSQDVTDQLDTLIGTLSAIRRSYWTVLERAARMHVDTDEDLDEAGTPARSVDDSGSGLDWS